MSSSYKPEGYNCVSPYLVVDGAASVIDFLIQVFEAVPLRRYERPDGAILHAEVRIGDSVVMLGDTAGRMAPVLGYTHIYVPDVDATHQRALAAGAVSIQQPQRQKDDPDRRGGFKDPAGNIWWVGTQAG